MEASGHIRRRGDDGVAIAFFGRVGLEDFVFLPECLPLSFGGLGFVLAWEVGESHGDLG